MKRIPKRLYRYDVTFRLEQWTPNVDTRELSPLEKHNYKGRWKALGYSDHNIFYGYPTKKAARDEVIKRLKKQVVWCEQVMDMLQKGRL